VAEILNQLGLDQTFFIQLLVFAVLFFILKPLYFRPFQRLFEARHKRTVEDREAAEKLSAQAEAKYLEYKDKLSAERVAIKRDYEAMIAEARAQEAAELAKAREEAKKITQEAVESIAKQREQLKKQLEADVDGLARTISEKLLSRKV
jgi:F-type H+-transporting ATPase subunit b